MSSIDTLGERQAPVRRTLLCAIGLRGIPDVPGGIESQCETLYPELIVELPGLEVVVIGRSKYCAGGIYRGVRVIPIWAPRHRVLESLVHTALALLYARLFVHPKIVHLHGIGPGFFALFARILGFAVIGTHHAFDYHRPKWRWFGRAYLRLGEWSMFQFSNRVAFVSDWLYRQAKSAHPTLVNKFATVHNAPISLPGAPIPISDRYLFHRLGVEPRKYILAVGRLDESKGFHDLIAAYLEVAPYDMKLVIAGEAFTKSRYVDDLRSAASPNIIFAGALSHLELDILYSATALFVHPSHIEGFGIVILEALRADAPILVSDIPSSREFDLPAKHYYPVGDIDSLELVLRLPDYSSFRFGDRARILEKFSLGEHVQKYADVLRVVAKGRFPPRCTARVIEKTLANRTMKNS